MDPQTDMDLCCLIGSKPGEAPPNKNPSQFVLRAAQLLERETKFVVKPLPNASELTVIWLNILRMLLRCRSLAAPWQARHLCSDPRPGLDADVPTKSPTMPTAIPSSQFPSGLFRNCGH
jgi:hypothetical protein